MGELLKNIIIETRPRQWVKNLTIYVFLVFSPDRELVLLHQFLIVSYSFIAFTLLTSGVYIINDLIDIESDRKNPEKKNRPIASGKISKNLGIILAIIFLLLSFILSWIIGEYLFIMCLFYFILMILYSLWLKRLVIIDALVIAGGFVVRVLAGAFIINVPNLYSWLIIVTISIALLLGFGKRRSELTLLGSDSKYQRSVLEAYPVDLLNSLISALVSCTFLSYILFTFQTDLTGNFGLSGFIKLPSPLYRTSHLLKLTIPIVFYGIARYLYIIYTKKDGSTPETVLFKDKPLLFTIILWILSTVVLLYAFK